MNPEEKSNQMRTAIIESNDKTPIIENLKQHLPEGYSIEKLPADRNNYSNERNYVIKTPDSDEIHLVEESDKRVTTCNIINQDLKDQPPSLSDDELSKLSRAIDADPNAEKHISVQVIASKVDING